MNKDTPINCPECEKAMVMRNLKPHLRARHKYDDNRIEQFRKSVTPRKDGLECCECEAILKTEKTLILHKARMHKETEDPNTIRLWDLDVEGKNTRRRAGIPCPEPGCDQLLSTQIALIDHVNDVHIIESGVGRLKVIRRCFASEADYKIWLKDQCCKEMTGFKMNSCRRSDSRVIQYFRCRNVATSSSMKTLKSYKTYLSCTCYMKTLIEEDKSIEVEACFTHSHPLDLSRFPLSDAKTDLLGQTMFLDIPDNKIIQDIWKNCRDKRLVYTNTADIRPMDSDFCWEYELSRGKWVRFSDEISKKLNSGDPVQETIEEAAFTLDPVQLKSINMDTGFRRNIRCSQKTEDGFVVWEHVKGRAYTALPMTVCSTLEHAHSSGGKETEIELLGQKWSVNLEKFRMTFEENETKIRRIISEAESSMSALPTLPATRNRVLTKRPGSVNVGITVDEVKKEIKEEEEVVPKKRGRKAKEVKNEEDEPSTSTKSTVKSTKSTRRVVIMKGRAPVDPECEEKIHTAHVLEEGDTVWDVMLNQTNIGNNNNKYYIMQLLEDDNSKSYSVWFRWGRVGYRGQMGLQKFGSDIEAAKKCLCKKFLDKTRNEFYDRANFEPSPGKYTLIHVDYSAIASQQQELIKKEETDEHETPEESKLDQRVQDLMALICNLQAMEETVLEMEYDSARAPLGKLTPNQISEGYRILGVIENFIKKSNFGRDFVNAVNEYYTKIPHAFGFRQPPLIKTQEQLQKELDLLDVLEDIEIAMRYLGTGASKGDKRATVDRYYENMKCNLKPLEEEDEDYQIIEQYLHITHGSTHMYKMNIKNIYAVERETEAEKFKAEIGNRMLLWHGSRLTNYYGILSQGLRIAPPEAPSCGYMFGKGVYFADMASKSGNYCHAMKGKPGLLLLSEVALGECNVLRDADYNANKLPAGKSSTMGYGRTQPDESQFIKRDDGLVIPCGAPKTTASERTSLLYNEFIVYDTDQIRMRYLVEVVFDM